MHERYCNGLVLITLASCLGGCGLERGAAEGWVEIEGERLALSHAAGLRVTSCPGQSSILIIASDRPLTALDEAQSLAPPDWLSWWVHHRMSTDGIFVTSASEDGSEFEASRQRYKERGVGFGGYGSHGALLEITDEDSDYVAGRYSVAADVADGEGSFDFEFNAPIIDLTVGESMPVGGGYLGTVIHEALESPSWQTEHVAAEFSLLGGLTDEERGLIWFEGDKSLDGAFYLARYDGQWEVVQMLTCEK